MIFFDEVVLVLVEGAAVVLGMAVVVLVVVVGAGVVVVVVVVVLVVLGGVSVTIPMPGKYIDRLESLMAS